MSDDEKKHKEIPLSTEPYKGVRDFYPEDWARMQSVFSTIRETLRLWGYEEYNASPLERAELYERKTSEEIVNEQTYTFFDRGDRKVTLRPEMTPSLARMVAGKRRELVYPLRWFSIGNRFRYERPQKGRLREFYQIDVDLIGFPDGKGESEAVVIASTILHALGAKDSDFIIRVNSRELLNKAAAAVGLSDEDTTTYLGLLDRKNKVTPEKFEEERAPFRRNGMDPLELIEQRADAEVEEFYQNFQEFVRVLKELYGVTNVVFDPTIVRGFLYYTGLVFEVFDTNPANPRALMGGGKYDKLVGMFGGEQIPAVGFAIGEVTLMDFLETHNISPTITSGAQVYIGTPSEADISAAQEFALKLRANGVRALVHVGTSSSSKFAALGDQIRDASRRGIPYFIAYGEQEAASGTVRLKKLDTSEERELPVAEVPSAIS
jgi:histidyl-tRNA synthetase